MGDFLLFGSIFSILNGHSSYNLKTRSFPAWVAKSWAIFDKKHDENLVVQYPGVREITCCTRLVYTPHPWMFAHTRRSLWLVGQSTRRMRILRMGWANNMERGHKAFWKRWNKRLGIHEYMLNAAYWVVSGTGGGDSTSCVQQIPHLKNALYVYLSFVCQDEITYYFRSLFLIFLIFTFFLLPFLTV